MNSHADTAAPGTHRAVQQLLPWLLAGTLEGAELSMVQAHVHTCALCQADLDWQRSVRAAGPQPGPELDPERALARLLPRLGPQAPRPGVLERWRQAIAANDGSWLRWTAAAQLLVIAVLGLMLARPGEDGAYRALGAPARAQGSLVVVFKPETPERELRRIVQSSGARVADGPTVTGAYVLAVPKGQTARALAGLRAEPAVTLAQALDAGSQP